MNLFIEDDSNSLRGGFAKSQRGQLVRRGFAMTEREVEFAEDLAYSGPILRKLMDRDEIKLAERLVQNGVITKGRSDDRQKTIQYSVDKDTLYEILDEDRIGQIAERATHGRA